MAEIDGKFHAKEQYFPPIVNVPSFHCPNCGVYSRQYWGDVQHNRDKFSAYTIGKIRIAQCERCKLHSYWKSEKMIYPITSMAPPPSIDMPEDLQEDFQEARNVVMISPRAAAALLRLAIQKLMPHLGEKGDNINDDIASLVKKGLSETVQKALDSVRVIGNNAVHPGQMDIKDDIETATSLFDLLNFIVDELITKPKQIADIYDKIPKSKKEAIKKRNSRVVKR